jgi:hypothetical protein
LRREKIVAQVGKRGKTVKKIRRIKIQLTSREILATCGGTNEAMAETAFCPLCHSPLAESKVLDGMITEAVAALTGSDETGDAPNHACSSNAEIINREE